MKLFIYKLSIATLFLYILFEFTLGSRIDYYTEKLKSLNNQQTRLEIKDKMLIEMKKGSEKEEYFSKDEREIISSFINKILDELKINTK
tara:strand:+ start:256 stop:522 length:267 start_codon:yes stop_codon:yes gene_type:complete